MLERTKEGNQSLVILDGNPWGKTRGNAIDFRAQMEALATN